MDSGVGPEKSIGEFPAGRWPESGDWHRCVWSWAVCRQDIGLLWAGSASSSRLSGKKGFPQVICSN